MKLRGMAIRAALKCLSSHEVLMVLVLMCFVDITKLDILTPKHLDLMTSVKSIVNFDNIMYSINTQWRNPILLEVGLCLLYLQFH